MSFRYFRQLDFFAPALFEFLNKAGAKKAIA